MVTIIGKTIAGRLHTFYDVLDIRYQANRNIPCDSFSFVTVAQRVTDEFCEITATLAGKPLFWGIVDTTELINTAVGQLLKFSCRNITALLLDNEVKPNIYARLTSSELVDRYAKPFGIAGSKFPYNASQWLMQVKKGMSYWAVIDEFCRVNYRAKPYVNRDRVLTLSPVNKTVHTFSNFGGGIRYSEISVKRDYYKLISRVYVKTSADNGNNYYGFTIENAVANRCKQRRERCLHPTDARLSMNPVANAAINKTLSQDTARSLIAKSNEEHYSIILKLPVLMDFQVGDGAVVLDKFVGNEQLFVESVSLTASKGGLGTTIVLRRVG